MNTYLIRSEASLYMSMNRVIDNIALIAEENNYPSSLQGYLYCGFPSLLEEWKKMSLDSIVIDEKTGLVLVRSPEKIKQVDRLMYDGGFPPPKLSIEQIKKITANYPFQLPLEVIQLYRRGNGMLPIGLGDKDWQSFNNYFLFPGTDIVLNRLCEAMDEYEFYLNAIANSSKKINDIVQYLFPIMSFEEMTWAVIGSEQQQDTSPVFFYYSEDIDSERFKPEIVWPSLTEMFKNNDKEEWPFNPDLEEEI